MAVTSNSYVHNPDGDGFYAGGVVEKSVDKIDLLKYKSLLIDSKIILSHQRISTSGLSSRYTHPFINKDFVLIHNGIINEFLGKNGSDTYGFFKQFCKQFYLNKKENYEREENIRISIKGLLDELDWGSFSIAILDKVTNNLYYFKNDDTDIHFYINPELLYITTLEENKVFLTMLGLKFREKKPKDFRIYRINTGEKINAKIIGKIKKPSNSYSSSYAGWQGFSERKNQYPSNVIYTNNDEEKLTGECANCDRRTSNWNMEKVCWLCSDCEEFYKGYDQINEGKQINEDELIRRQIVNEKYYDLRCGGGV